jgi:hypothetical protein
VEAKVHQRHLSRILYFSLVRVPVVQMKGTQVLYTHGTMFRIYAINHQLNYLFSDR